MIKDFLFGRFSTWINGDFNRLLKNWMDKFRGEATLECNMLFLVILSDI